MIDSEIINQKLGIIKRLQQTFVDAYVGGSFGIFLHGIDLKRSLNQSDIDMSVQSTIDYQKLVEIDELEEASNPEDFDYCFRYNHFDSYTKIDVRRNSEGSFIVIERDGVSYNVAKLEDIIVWKEKYAAKGVQKHSDDLIVIRGGERPERTPEQAETITDDLPF